jgi:tetratricopeptide (TPR) repeat protein
MQLSDSERRKISSIITELANVGEFLIANGHYERAISVFNILSEGDPTFEGGSYAYDLGICHEMLENPTKAKEYFEIAARENPQIPKYVSAAMKYK